MSQKRTEIRCVASRRLQERCRRPWGAADDEEIRMDRRHGRDISLVIFAKNTKGMYPNRTSRRHNFRASLAAFVTFLRFISILLRSAIGKIRQCKYEKYEILSLELASQHYSTIVVVVIRARGFIFNDLILTHVTFSKYTETSIFAMARLSSKETAQSVFDSRNIEPTIWRAGIYTCVLLP